MKPGRAVQKKKIVLGRLSSGNHTESPKRPKRCPSGARVPLHQDPRALAPRIHSPPAKRALGPGFWSSFWLPGHDKGTYVQQKDRPILQAPRPSPRAPGKPPLARMQHGRGLAAPVPAAKPRFLPWNHQKPVELSVPPMPFAGNGMSYELPKSNKDTTQLRVLPIFRQVQVETIPILGSWDKPTSPVLTVATLAFSANAALVLAFGLCYLAVDASGTRVSSCFVS